MPRSPSKSAPPGHHRRRVLTARALAAKLAWLQGVPCLRDGRFVWTTAEGGAVSPDAELLARTERALHRLTGHRADAERAFGADWLPRVTDRWREVKSLAGVQVANLPEVLEGLRRGEAEPVRRGLALARLEALGAEFAVSPAAALAGAGGPARAALAEALTQPAPPVLLALCLGAADRRADAWTPLPKAAVPLRRAYDWGRAFGWPSEPRLVLAILRHEPDQEAARRLFEDWEGLRHLQPRAGPLGTMLAEHGAAAAGRYLGGLASLDRHLRRLARGPALPPDASRTEQVVHRNDAKERPAEVLALAGLLRGALAPAPSAAESTAALDLLLDYLLEIAGPTLALTRALTLLARIGEPLTPELFAVYVEMLARQRKSLWSRESCPVGRLRSEISARAAWLINSCEWEARRLVRLLRGSGDPDAVRLATDHDFAVGLGQLEWKPDGLLGLTVGAGVALNAAVSDLYGLKARLELLPPKERSGTCRAVVQALGGVPRGRQTHYLGPLWRAVACEREAIRRDLPGALAAVRRIAVADAHDADADCFCDELLEAAVHLRRTHPRHAADWFDWLIGQVQARRPRGEVDWKEYSAFTRGVQIGAAFCRGAAGRFRALFAAGFAQHSDPPDFFEKGVAALAKEPEMADLLAAAYLAYPGRSEKLITSAGLALRMRPDALARLAELAPTVADAEALGEDGWEPVVELAPDHLALAAGYVRAQRILGGECAPPAGLREALALPDKLKRELAHLDRRVGEGASPALAARRDNLRARLADPERLTAQAAAEASERLRQAALLARLDAAWRLVDDVFRDRLEQIAGPLPPGLEITPDLSNAALLGMDIRSNRALLRKLIRASLRGDADWVRRQPANAAFLQSLAERGVAVDVWLGRHERRYRCAEAPGGHVRLHLETDPLHVLQMGNYFDTCLSFGHCNAFSTVANACELNKRVLYVTDARGRVVGRKLLAINDAGELVGFRTYTSLSDAAQNEAVRQAVRRYSRRFARRCGLLLGERGSVPLLLAQDWYDDGIEDWSANPKRRGRAGGSSRSPHSTQ
jgi:hypothetical protein